MAKAPGFISDEEMQKLQAGGKAVPGFISDAEMKRITTPVDNRSVADKIWDKLGSVGQYLVPGAVDTLGSNIANIANVIDPRTSMKQKLEQDKYIDKPSLKKNIGAGLEIAPYAAGLSVAGGVAGPAGFSKGVIAGAKVGAKVGAASGAATRAGASLSRDESVGEALKEGAIGAVQGGTAGGVIGGIAGGIGGAVKAYKEFNAPDRVAIEAVDPNLKGKKLSAAYKEVVTGKRQAQTMDFFGNQDLKPPKDVEELGLRLKDSLKSHDPLTNLTTLGQDLKRTEAKLAQAIRGAPDVVYTADKPTILQTLEDVKSVKPREFKSIRESGKIFDDVIGYAKEVIEESDDTLEGLRKARTAFDLQAKREYPSAFKEGTYIDIKTPAGRAIKLARDLINDHLYATAPNGSELQALIKREADIFRAADYIGPKAAEMHGLTKLTKIAGLFKDHPIVAGVGALAILSAGVPYIARAAGRSAGSESNAGY